MPGSDDQYDQVHTYSQDHAGKSKTTKPAVREIGRDGAPLRLLVGQQRDEPRTPPSGVLYFYTDDATNWKLKRPDGTVETIPSAGGTLTDSGSDNPDGGDIYELPAAEDSISLQGSGKVTDAEALGPAARFVGEDRDPANVGTPASGEVYLFFDTNQNPRVKDSTGTVASPVDGQAITPSSVSTGKINTTRHAESISELETIANNTGGGVKITLPNGTLTPSAVANLADVDDIVIEGQGPRSTLIDMQNIGGALFNFDNIGDVTESRIIIRDLMIQSDGTAGDQGIYLGRTRFTKVENVQVIGMADAAIEVEGGGPIHAFDNCLLRSNNSHGIFIHKGSAAASPNACTVHGGTFFKNGGEGLRVEDVFGLDVQGISIRENDGWGVLTSKVRAPRIHVVNVENNGLTLDRDGDGDVESADIGLSPPDGPGTGITDSATVSGDFFPSNKAGGHSYIVAGDCDGLTLTGCQFEADANVYADLEIGSGAKDIRVTEGATLTNGARQTHGGSSGAATVINSGRYETDLLGGYAAVETFVDEFVTSKAPTVIFTSDVSSSSGDTVAAGLFPNGTTFKGADKNTTISNSDTGGGKQCISVKQDQTLEHITCAKTAGSARAIQIAGAEADTTIRDVVVTDSPAAGIVVGGDRALVTGCTFVSGGISGSNDIDVNGTADRIVANDGSVDTSNATNPATAANTDNA